MPVVGVPSQSIFVKVMAASSKVKTIFAPVTPSQMISVGLTTRHFVPFQFSWRSIVPDLPNSNSKS